MNNFTKNNLWDFRFFFLVFEHESSSRDCYNVSLKHSSSCAEFKSYMRQICCFFHILTFWPSFFFLSHFFFHLCCLGRGCVVGWKVSYRERWMCIWNFWGLIMRRWKFNGKIFICGILCMGNCCNVIILNWLVIVLRFRLEYMNKLKQYRLFQHMSVHRWSEFQPYYSLFVLGTGRTIINLWF